MILTMHVRCNGKTYDIPLADLDIGNQPLDHQVISALAVHMDTTAAQFDRYVVERHDNGGMTIRPEDAMDNTGEKSE